MQSIMVFLPEQLSFIWAISTLGGLYIIFKLATFGSREKHLPRTDNLSHRWQRASRC
jgi:hypothetical protein